MDERDKDPDHWLYRFDADEWLRAAEGELRRGEAALRHKQQRSGVATARRAAGMAWNAVLVVTSDESGYGRSYMDHLHALAKDATVPEEVSRAAGELVAAPLHTELVALGRGDAALARAAEVIVAHAKERVCPSVKA